MKQNFIVIILPMYNEELSIPSIRKMFGAGFLFPPECEYKIIVVNDGSNDKTLNLVNNWSRENHKISVISHTRNMGVGQAILTGFNEAIRLGSNCVVTMDADASHPGQIVSLLVERILAGADIAIASRFAGDGGQQIGVPWQRKVYSLGARIILSIIFPLRGVSDYTVGFRAYKTALLHEALEKNPDSFLNSSSFAASAEILLKMATLAGRIEEVPLVLRYDHKKSPSKLRLWYTISDYLKLFLLPKKKCSLGRGLSIP